MKPLTCLEENITFNFEQTVEILNDCMTMEDCHSAYLSALETKNFSLADLIMRKWKSIGKFQGV